nr:MAG TPA: hypothetical protein [Caudoviricetes sp.]
MDAVKFIEERKRLCGTHDICKDCPANGNTGCMFNLNGGADADEQVNFLKEWVAAHPRKTRQSVFLKLFPGADVGETDGCLTLDPCNVYKKMRKECEGRKCSECRRKFWLAEVEE